MFNLADAQTENGDMPIQVYADEAAAEEAGVPDADVTEIQQRLYELGVIDAGKITEGMLDTETLRGIAAFQERINALYDADLEVIDPVNFNGEISTETIEWLFELEW